MCDFPGEGGGDSIFFPGLDRKFEEISDERKKNEKFITLRPHAAFNASQSHPIKQKICSFFFFSPIHSPHFETSKQTLSHQIYSAHAHSTHSTHSIKHKHMKNIETHTKIYSYECSNWPNRGQH